VHGEFLIKYANFRSSPEMRRGLDSTNNVTIELSSDAEEEEMLEERFVV
jgi:hypothetical protein